MLHKNMFALRKGALQDFPSSGEWKSKKQEIVKCEHGPMLCLDNKV